MEKMADESTMNASIALVAFSRYATFHVPTGQTQCDGFSRNDHAYVFSLVCVQTGSVDKI